MSHTGVYPFGNGGMHILQEGRRSMYPLDRHMGVGIAGTDKDRSTIEISLIILRVDPIPYQSAGEGSHAAEFCGMPGDKFKCKTGSLGKTQEIYMIIRDARGPDPGQQLPQLFQRCRQPGFVLRRRGKK